MNNRDKFKIGDRVRDGFSLKTGTIHATDGDGEPLVDWDDGTCDYVIDSLLELDPGDTTQNVDMVHQPPHYRGHPKGIECIDVIEDNPFVNLAQSQKYVWRVSWGGKGDDIEDLEKAVWYLNREIARRKK